MKICKKCNYSFCTNCKNMAKDIEFICCQKEKQDENEIDNI